MSDGVALGDVDLSGVSLGSGVGEVFFFRRGDVIGEGEGEIFFFLTDALGEGAGDFSSVGRGDAVFFGVAPGDGVGVFLLLPGEDFFFRGFGVGVGVEKILLILSPNDSSAAGAAGANVQVVKLTKIKRRISTAVVLTDFGTISIVEFSTAQGRDEIARKRG